MQFQPILHFKFAEITPKHHFTKDAAVDEVIRIRFGVTLTSAEQCGLFA